MIKSVLFTSLVASTLLAGIVEKKSGTFIELFSDNDPQSKKVALLSVDNAKIEILKCKSNKYSDTWCSIRYSNDDVILNGYSDKKSLDIISSKPNNNPTFEIDYGGNYKESANKLLKLKDGFLLVGESESFGEGMSDAYVIKTDKFGNKIWSRTYGGRGDDVAKDVVQMRDSFVFSGNTRSFGSLDQSMYVFRTKKDGTLLWQKGFYSDKDDRYSGNSLVKINDDFVLVAGHEDHAKFFDSEVNIYLSAVDMNGKRTWVERYGGEDQDVANSIIKVKGGYVFAGYTETWGHGDKDAYIVKIDEKGDRIWHNAIGYHDDEVAKQIIQTSDGGYALVGFSNSSRRNMKDVFVAKLDANGNVQWQGLFGSREDDEGLGIVEDNGNLVVVAYTKYTKKGKKGIYLLKLSQHGTIIYERVYAGSEDQVANAIINTKDGYAMAGYTKNTPNRNQNMLFMKVDKDGNL
jgi:hypothetical protein